MGKVYGQLGSQNKRGFMDGYFGCEVVYKNGRCVKLHDLDHDIEGAGIAGPNKVYVKCGGCNRYMKYDSFKDIWKCESCGKTVRGGTPYHYIERVSRDEFEDYGVYYPIN